MLVDDATFEKALVQACEKNGELTTAALLREIREIVTPAGADVLVRESGTELAEAAAPPLCHR